MEKTINENELENVGGGLHNYPASCGYKVEVNGVEYDVVDDDWGCPCRELGHDPVPGGDLRVMFCLNCRDYRRLSDIGKGNINGWQGYCVWK